MELVEIYEDQSETESPNPPANYVKEHCNGWLENMGQLAIDTKEESVCGSMHTEKGNMKEIKLMPKWYDAWN